MQRCPFCGAPRKRGEAECTECGKSAAGQTGVRDKAALTSRDAYNKRNIPVWLFVVIVGIFLFGLILIFIR